MFKLQLSWWDRLWGHEYKLQQQRLIHMRALEASFATYPDLRPVILEGSQLAGELAAMMKSAR